MLAVAAEQAGGGGGNEEDPGSLEFDEDNDEEGEVQGEWAPRKGPISFLQAMGLVRVYNEAGHILGVVPRKWIVGGHFSVPSDYEEVLRNCWNTRVKRYDIVKYTCVRRRDVPGGDLLPHLPAIETVFRYVKTTLDTAMGELMAYTNVPDGFHLFFYTGCTSNDNSRTSKQFGLNSDMIGIARRKGDIYGRPIRVAIEVNGLGPNLRSLLNGLERGWNKKMRQYIGGDGETWTQWNLTDDGRGGYGASANETVYLYSKSLFYFLFD